MQYAAACVVNDKTGDVVKERKCQSKCGTQGHQIVYEGKDLTAYYCEASHSKDDLQETIELLTALIDKRHVEGRSANGGYHGNYGYRTDSYGNQPYESHGYVTGSYGNQPQDSYGYDFGSYTNEDYGSYDYSTNSYGNRPYGSYGYGTGSHSNRPYDRKGYPRHYHRIQPYDNRGFGGDNQPNGNDGYDGGNGVFGGGSFSSGGGYNIRENDRGRRP